MKHDIHALHRPTQATRIAHIADEQTDPAEIVTPDELFLKFELSGLVTAEDPHDSGPAGEALLDNLRADRTGSPGHQDASVSVVRETVQFVRSSSPLPSWKARGLSRRHRCLCVYR